MRFNVTQPERVNVARKGRFDRDRRNAGDPEDGIQQRAILGAKAMDLRDVPREFGGLPFQCSVQAYSFGALAKYFGF